MAMTKMTEAERQHIIDIFKWRGMCSDCIDELKLALKDAKLDDTSTSWYEFLCYECQLIYRDMVPEVLKRREQEKKNDKTR
jgi:hypothetical protein